MNLGSMNVASEADSVTQFLQVKTPDAWLQLAPLHLDTLLIDHAHCEKKAASTALNLMYRYVDRPELLHKMAQLAREELLHFEQVLALMERRDIAYQHLSPSRYAQEMRRHVRTHEPARLIDTLIVGAFIEARSCERFAALADSHLLDEELSKYYRYLLKSESRHFLDYLALAKSYSGTDSLAKGAHDLGDNSAPDNSAADNSTVDNNDDRRVDNGTDSCTDNSIDESGLDDYEARIVFFRSIENSLIVKEDTHFRFHSGVIWTEAEKRIT